MRPQDYLWSHLPVPGPGDRSSSTHLCGPPAANPGPADLGYLKHHCTDNAHCTIWSFPPQPQMPETLFQRNEIIHTFLVHALLGAACLSEAEPGYRSGLRVSRRQGKNQTQLIGEVNSVQHHGNENKFPSICFHTCLLKLAAVFLCCQAAWAFLLWGCNSMPPSMLWKLFCPQATETEHNFVWQGFSLKKTTVVFNMSSP